MKFAIFVLFGILVSCYANPDIDALKRDVKDFEPLIPKVSLGMIVAKHYIFDSGFRTAKNFIGSAESNALGVKIMKSRPFRELVDDLRKKDIDIPGIINMLAAQMNYPYYPEDFEDEILIQPRTLNSFIDEVVGALPKDKFKSLIHQKMQSSPVFKKFLQVATSADFNKKVEKILNYQPLRPTFDTFKSKNIDIKHIYEAVKTIFSWGH